MKRIREEGRAEGFIIGAVVGAAIAAITALLFAPKSGKDLRKDIGDGATKTWEQTDEYLDVAKQKGTKMMHDVEETASSYFNVAGDKVGDAFAKTKGMFRRKADEVEDVVEDVKADVEDVAADVKEKAEDYNTSQFADN